MNIVLIDSSEVFRMGLRSLLATAPEELSVIGEFDVVDLRLILDRGAAPELVISDLNPAGQNGIALARELRRVAASVRLLILASQGPESVVRQALAAGAVGYALKSQPAADILRAIRSAGAGQPALPPGIRPLEDRPRAPGKRPVAARTIDRLSTRERQVFDLAIWGRSNREIAEQLAISVKTVETHRGHINSKLHIHTTADMVRLASFWGLLAQERGAETVRLAMA